MAKGREFDGDAIADATGEQPAILYKMDHPRSIDRYIDYFGEPRGL
jgi:hypothetical protein